MMDPSSESGSPNNMEALDISPWACLDPDRSSHIPIPDRPWAVSVSLIHASYSLWRIVTNSSPSCLMLMQSASSLYT